MIKKIILKNFEAHQDSEIEFSDGLNIIVGPSNQGKSSIIRALALVVANRFDKQSVRTGCDFCSVTVETEKGWIKAERGESVNRWTVCKNGQEQKIYHSIGTDTPPETLEILGMEEKSRGDLKELPNIMFQLEKHYMLSEIDGKKATSNIIARMMDEAIGIGGMEELIKDMANDFQSFKKELNSFLSEISEEKGKIMEESIFKEKEDSVKRTKELYIKLEEAERLLEESEIFSKKIAETKSNLSLVKVFLPILCGLERSWEGLNQKAMEYMEISSAAEKQSKLKDLKNILEAFPSLESLFASLLQKTDELEKLEKLAKLIAERKKFPELPFSQEEIEKRFSDLKTKEERIVEASDCLKKARQTFLSKRKAENLWKETSSEYEKVKKEFEELKATFPVCPLCGTEWEKDKHIKE